MLRDCDRDCDQLKLILRLRDLEADSGGILLIDRERLCERLADCDRLAAADDPIGGTTLLLIERLLD